MRKEGFGKLVSLSEAKKIVFENAQEVGDEKVLLENAFGRVLAEDIVSEVDVPPFRKSAMDGFAVIASDTFGVSNTQPKILTQVSEIYPGSFPDKEVKTGECIEIATGAPVPDGADAILMVEYTEKENEKITIYKTVAPGDHIIKAGSDIKKGETNLAKGMILNPRQTAVLAAIGMNEVPVKKQSVVAVCSTGNELIRPPAKLEKGQIYESNSRSIIDSLKELNCIPIDLGNAKDTKEDLREKLERGVEKADIVLMSGGSSMGTTDLLEEVINELGELLIHGIAIKPGKPTIVSIIKNKLVFGLPGHPASALSNFYIIIKPLLMKMLRAEEVEERYTEAELTRKVVSTIGRYEFLSVKLIKEDDKHYAEPVWKGSSAITTLANANGFVEIDENIEVVEKGETVRVKLL